MTPRPRLSSRLSSLLPFAALCAASCLATAQTPAAPLPSPKPAEQTATLHFVNISQTNDENEVVTDLRLMLDPSVRLFLAPSQNAISIHGTPAQIEEARKLVAELDHQRRSYRLTYTLTESDAGKRLGVQNFAMVVAAGARTTLKDGSKVPVVTGASDPASKTFGTQFTYLDIGLNIDNTLDEAAGGARLRAKIEQSSAQESTTLAGVNEPIVRQAVFEGTAVLEAGKLLRLTSLDIPGSTRHLDIDVLMEPVR